MKLEYFVVAENVSIDQTTNQISVFNIREEVTPLGFPITVSLVCLAGLLGEPEDKGKEFQIMTRINLPDGEVNEFAQNFTVPGRRHRAIIRFEGVPIKCPGILEIELLLNSDHAATHIIDINSEEDPAMEDPAMEDPLERI